jgi:sec-independent protein translocase protein TatA
MLTQFAVAGLGAPELLLILAIVLLLFGGKKLPQLSRSVGESMQELRKGLSGGDAKKNSDKEKQQETVS